MFENWFTAYGLVMIVTVLAWFLWLGNYCVVFGLASLVSLHRLCNLKLQFSNGFGIFDSRFARLFVELVQVWDLLTGLVFDNRGWFIVWQVGEFVNRLGLFGKLAFGCWLDMFVYVGSGCLWFFV